MNTCGRCSNWEPNFLNYSFKEGQPNKCLKLCALSRADTSACRFFVENPKRDCDRMPSQEEREIVKEEIVNNRRIITVRRGHVPAGCHAATTNMMINEAIKKFY